MILLPIGTDVRLRRAPIGNYALIIANVAIFLFTDVLQSSFGRALKEFWTLDASRPLIWQYVTYQFLHGDLWHLLGNMLFLWIFGNAVCDRMGTIPYLLFYLGGGVAAGAVFATTADNPMVGASGAIAAVTTGFLALFPRVHIHLLIIFVFIMRFALPAVVLIVFKIILWDNILAPSLEHGAMQQVAYSAHLGGYAFGFIGAMLLLATDALPRNQFDLAALWDRWRRRSGLQTITAGGRPYARSVQLSELESRPLDDLELSAAEQQREAVMEQVRGRDFEAAAAAYARLVQLDPELALPRGQQLALANWLAQQGRHRLAAVAYDAFLQAYPTATEAPQVHLFLGMILGRYLGDDAAALEHLSAAAHFLTRAEERELALQELRTVQSRTGGA